MAGRKKGDAAQLQIEVNTDEEWQQLLDKKGLFVVDVYSEWCGPCVGMLGNLKKLKMEVGDDLLQYAIAKADHISALARFRDRSEPTWILIASGHPVAIILGADAPRLSRSITKELAKEKVVLDGKAERQTIPIDKPTEEEKKRAQQEEMLLGQKAEMEDEDAVGILNTMRAASSRRLAKAFRNFAVLLLAPTANAAGIDVSEALKELGFEIHDKQHVVMELESVTELLEITESDDWIENDGQCEAILLKMDLEMDTEAEDPETTCDSTLKKILENEEYDSFWAKLQIPAGSPKLWMPPSDNKKLQVVQKWFPESYASLVPSVIPAHERRVLVIFSNDRLEELTSTLEELGKDVLARSTVTIDEEQVKQIVEDEEIAAQLTSGSMLALAIHRASSGPLKILQELGPIYVSDTPEKGIFDVELLFPDKKTEVEVNVMESKTDEEKTETKVNVVESKTDKEKTETKVNVAESKTDEEETEVNVVESKTDEEKTETEVNVAESKTDEEETETEINVVESKTDEESVEND